MRRRITVRTLLASVVCVSSLAACGGGDDGDDGSPPGPSDGSGSGSGSALGERLLNPTPELQGSFRYYGYVDLIDDTLEERVNYDANFLQMTEVQPASTFANSVPPAVDACNLRVTTSIPTDAGTIGFPEAPFDLVSAGDTYVLTGEAGTYAEIDRSASRFDIAPYPMPDGLTLDIPGDVFPGFAGVAVPDQITVRDFRPARSESLSADTEVTWTPSGVSGNSVYLRTFDFPRGDRVVDLRCRMADDGSFTLPDDVVARLNETLSEGWSLAGTEQERSASGVVIQGDALLVVTRRQDSL